MERMMSYIFGSLQRCDENFTQIERAFKSQNKLNKLMVLSLLITTYATYSSFKEYRIKIERLNKEIEQLKAKQKSTETTE